MKKLKLNTIISLGLILGLLALLAMPLAQITNAAALTSLSDTMTSLKVSTASDHTITFTTPTGVSAGQTITITFPSGWDLTSIGVSDLDLVEGATDKTLSATCSGTTWGAAVSGQVITFTSCTDTIAASSAVTVKIGTVATGGTNQITNSATTGSHTISIGGTMSDSGSIVVTLLSDDQVAATATVSESLSFSISDNSITFGTLSSSNAKWASASSGFTTETKAHTISVGTNAASGYVLTVNGSILTSGANTITAIGATAAASSPGSEQYGIRVAASGGSGTVTSPYNSSNYALDTAAFPDQIASATGASSTTTYSVYYLANISANTEAGTYTSTLTYTATATY